MSQTIVKGARLIDRGGSQWIVRWFDSQFVWVNSYPTKEDEETIPFSYSLIRDCLTVVTQ